MKILSKICRIIIGLVFIFSGTVKAIDPLGSAYKFHDYFQAFNITFLNNLSLPLAIFLCTAEFIAGFSVLSGFRQKTGILGVLALMTIFTPLTLILAITNPVSDCGCFGDAIHLTNWQTFGKNIVLIILAIILYAERKQVKALYNKTIEWSIVTGVIVLFILFSLANIRYLPVIDFLPYKKGVKIADKMIIPPGVRADQYRTTFVYEKEGIKKEFNLNNYPSKDSTWKFVDQISVLTKSGYKPPIHDFIITSLNGEDLTQKVLAYPGYTVLMISKKLKEADTKRLTKGFELGKYCISNGINFYVLTSSGTDEVRRNNIRLLFCTLDETTLKTMIRANPGYILLKDGTILGKWSFANVPDKEWFGKLSDKEK
ncbi:MAG TPA: BT_3928 family protein [Bacteroidales bacterium]